MFTDSEMFLRINYDLQVGRSSLVVEVGRSSLAVEVGWSSLAVEVDRSSLALETDLLERGLQHLLLEHWSLMQKGLGWRLPKHQLIRCCMSSLYHGSLC